MMEGWLSSQSPFTSRNHGTTKGAKQERSGEVSVATLFFVVFAQCNYADVRQANRLINASRKLRLMEYRGGQLLDTFGSGV